MGNLAVGTRKRASLKILKQGPRFLGQKLFTMAVTSVLSPIVKVCLWTPEEPFVLAGGIIKLFKKDFPMLCFLNALNKLKSGY